MAPPKTVLTIITNVFYAVQYFVEGFSTKPDLTAQSLQVQRLRAILLTVELRFYCREPVEGEKKGDFSRKIGYDESTN